MLFFLVILPGQTYCNLLRYDLDEIYIICFLLCIRSWLRIVEILVKKGELLSFLLGIAGIWLILRELCCNRPGPIWQFLHITCTSYSIYQHTSRPSSWHSEQTSPERSSVNANIPKTTTNSSRHWWSIHLPYRSSSLSWIQYSECKP